MSWRLARSILVGAMTVVGAARAGEPNASEPQKGAYIIIPETLDLDAVARIRSQLGAASLSGARTVIFEIRTRKPSYGLCRDLAMEISRASGVRTVAFVPEPIQSHAALLVLACDEVAMAGKATLGVIGADEEPVLQVDREAYSAIIKRKGRHDQRALIMAMLDPGVEVIEIKTAAGAKRYVSPEELDQVRREQNIVEQKTVVEQGQAAVYTAEKAAAFELCNLILNRPIDVVRQYGLDPSTLGAGLAAATDLKAAIIRLENMVDPTMVEFLKRRAVRAVNEGRTLLIFQINSPGGLAMSGEEAANFIVDLAKTRNVKTLAFVDPDALSAASMIALACQQVAMRTGSRLGDCGALFIQQREFRHVPEKLLGPLKKMFQFLAETNGWDPLLLEGMVSKSLVIWELVDAKGKRVFMRDEDFKALVPKERERYTSRKKIKGNDEFLTVGPKEAVQWGLAQQVVEDEAGLMAVLGLRGADVPIIGRDWVDGVVDVLSDPWLIGILFTVGLIGLYAELTMPGFGVPGVLAIVCFALYFWAMYWSNSAGALEIMLFVIGLGLLALEIFVVPGFGVTGVAGILCMLFSLVLASQTFIIPATTADWSKLAKTLGILGASLFSFFVLAALMSRFLPYTPVFNRFVLPAPERDSARADAALQQDLGIEVGDTGKSLTVLRPAGKAKFGTRLVDVTSEGGYIEAGAPVEVLEVRGNRIVVRARRPRTGGPQA